MNDWIRLPCLLYTYDAADDLTRVDLGGRRIIKKKKKKKDKWQKLMKTRPDDSIVLIGKQY